MHQRLAAVAAEEKVGMPIHGSVESPWTLSSEVCQLLQEVSNLLLVLPFDAPAVLPR